RSLPILHPVVEGNVQQAKTGDRSSISSGSGCVWPTSEDTMALSSLVSRSTNSLARVMTFATIGILASLVAVGLVEAATIPVPCDAEALRAAIGTANSNGEANTLLLAANCTYTLSEVDNTTEGPNGLPVITGSITISGGEAVIERSSELGAPPFRLLFVDQTGELVLRNLTLRNGLLPTGPPGFGDDPILCRGGAGNDGGGVVTRGRLTLGNSSLIGNRAGSGGEGASHCNRGCEESSHCYGGQGGAGGGVFNQGILTVSDSTLRGNASGTGGCGGKGYGGGRGGD